MHAGQDEAWSSELAVRYDADPERLEELAARFVPLAPDHETERWLSDNATPHGFFRSLSVELLSRVMSSYDAHGLTATYPMHLLSTVQWRALVGRGERLLDVGAGAGYVTRYARPLFGSITCTETSPLLARRLRKRGFEVLEGDLGEGLAAQPPYDVISCLNVLDRTPYPRRLLQRLTDLCHTGTRLLLAMPLPVSAHVHVRGATISPSERLPDEAQSWERALLAVSRDLFPRAGLAIERIARVPYLSRGDRHAPRYVLDDALWVLRRQR